VSSAILPREHRGAAFQSPQSLAEHGLGPEWASRGKTDAPNFLPSHDDDEFGGHACACVRSECLIFIAANEEPDMAFDPTKTLYTYADTECSVQMWVSGASPVQFPSLKDAVSYASQQGGKWNEVEITVHLPREDIVYGTDKTRMLIDAVERASKRDASNPDS
jgi:hypothetical protein